VTFITNHSQVTLAYCLGELESLISELPVKDWLTN